MTAPKWLQLMLLLFCSFVSNHSFVTPTKYSSQTNAPVQVLVAAQKSSIPEFVIRQSEQLRWCDVFYSDNYNQDLDVRVDLRQQYQACLNIAQAPPLKHSLLLFGDEEPANS